MAWLRCFAWMLILSIASHGIATAEGPPGYEIGGICVKKGSDKPKERDGGRTIWYYEFDKVQASSQLESRVVLCPEDRLEAYVAFAERHAVARRGVSKSDLEWWNEALKDPISLTETLQCGILKDNEADFGLLILRTTLEAQRLRNNFGNQLLSLVQLDKQNKPTRFLSQFLTIESDTDITREVSMKYLCDANDDGRVELVLVDQRYAGYDYLMCSYEQNFAGLSCQTVGGAGGD